jgi:hypothetical protein
LANEVCVSTVCHWPNGAHLISSPWFNRARQGLGRRAQTARRYASGIAETRPIKVNLPGMDNDLIANMRGRIAHLRKVLSLSHDRRIVDMLGQVIAGIEADIERLEQEEGRRGSAASD